MPVAFEPNWIIRLEVVPSTIIKDAIAEAFAIISRLPVARVEFEFSGIPVTVTPRSNVKEVEAQWWKDTLDFNRRASETP